MVDWYSPIEHNGQLINRSTAWTNTEIDVIFIQSIDIRDKKYYPVG
jgi:hypothetical protein